MRKRGKKLLAMILAVSMAMNVMSFQAFADEPIVEVETLDQVLNDDGTVTDTTITTETETDDKGNVTVNVVIEQKTEGTSNDGVNIEVDSKTQTETITDKNGNLVEKNTVEEGTEKREWTEDVKPGDEVPVVEVTVKPGASNSETGSETYENEVPESEYDYEKITTTVNRNVTVNAEEEKIEVTVNDSGTDLECIKKEKHNVENGSIFYTKGDWDKYADPSAEKPSEPGYDFQMTGVDEIAKDNYRTNVWRVTYKTDDDGNPIRDANGDLIIESKIALNPSGAHSSGWDKLGYPTQTKMFVLTKEDENGEKERFFTYCIDYNTSLEDGKWYKISNLEDSDYYPDEESAAHLRAIANNGYWGTEEGTGSLDQIKTNILSAYEGREDETITVKDKNGNDKTYKVVDLIKDLCEGEALNVTQAAIWSYSNGALTVQTGNNNVLVNDNFSYALSKENDVDKGAASLARMRVMYNWLLGLKQEKTENVSTVINEQNFVEEISLEVGKKVDEVIILNDEDNTSTTNGIYETNLNFTLAFVPTENDDLLVCLKYVDLDGNEQTVTKRLAGNAQDGETYERLGRNEDGSYTFENLKLSENQKFDFDLNLEGTQYLKEGVYIYSAHGGVSESQTLVGIAKGTHTVDVTASMSLSFNVDEEKTVHVERHWRDVDTEKPHKNPSGGSDDDDNGGGGSTTTTTINDPNVPLAAADTIEITENDVPLSDGVLNIEDAPIPLAVLPMTGDVSVIWMLISLISGLGLAGVSFTDRKKRK